MLINFFDERDTFVKIDKLRNKLTKEIYEETCEELTECLIDIDLVHWQPLLNSLHTNFVTNLVPWDFCIPHSHGSRTNLKILHLKQNS